MQTGIIYQAFNKISQKSYIGQTTKSLHKRKNQHYISTTAYKYKFSNALNKYKEEDWDWRILAEVEIDKLDEYEIFFINDLDTYKNGYNSTVGGSWLGETNPRHNGTIYELWHPEYGEIRETISELSNRYSNFGSIKKLISGKFKHIKGFVLLENKENYNNLVKPAYHRFYNPEYGEELCTTKQLSEKYKLGYSQVRKVSNGKANIAFGWILYENKDNYLKYINRELFTFSHKEHGKVIYNCVDFAEKYNLKYNSVRHLKNRSRNSLFGWTIVE